ncbi:Clp protease [Arthrobacter sp. MYb227]|uniref:SRPBCC family protein n=1 Tax=Arthrobacter sp. MYb227 TaxID=1848601 RepID=UPI000CFC3AF8|nr:SRPBCC family protein [Arthrobacter sp. MYb227]PQZ93728.1 Clp protease [Arthrobacter sp. MYb227]
MSKFTDAATTSHTLSVAAMEEASRFGQRSTDIDHMFLALVVSEQVAGQVLRSEGITLEAAREAVVGQHSAQLASLGIGTRLPPQDRIVFHETGGYEWSDRALEILKRASRGEKRGDAAAVLRELVTEPSGMIDQVLKRLGSTPDLVMARLDEVQRYPAFTPKRAIQSGRRSGACEAFVPAPVKQVWGLLAIPTRMPEWEPMIGDVALEGTQTEPRIGDRWTTHARTQRSDGKPIRIKPEFQRQVVELVACTEGALIEWQFAYPDSARANVKRIRIELEPAAGGTQLRISLEWERNSTLPARLIRGVLVRPFVRFGIWMQLSQLSGGISRVFR